jgi:hypothetical protein
VRSKGRLFGHILPAEAARAPTSVARIALPAHDDATAPSATTLEADLAAARLDRVLPPAVLAIVADLIARLIAADAAVEGQRR